MVLSNESTVSPLLKNSMNEDKPAEERYAALKLVCKLRDDVYIRVPSLEQLRFVAAAMQTFHGIGPLTMKDAAEAVASGRARRAAAEARQ
jgi:hypothetical protein